MKKNYIMLKMKEKKCKVCSLFDDKNFSEEIKFNINKLIKSKQPTEVLNKETGFNLTDYYYKKHHDICIVDFIIPIVEQEIELKKYIKKTENVTNNLIDIKLIIEEYRQMSEDDKLKSHCKNIDEIKYLTGYITNHNLINGYSYKGFIPKEDINSLKVINDISNDNIDDNFKLFFKGKSSREIFNNSFEVFNQGKLTLKQMYNISKLTFTIMKIEDYFKEDKIEHEQQSMEELEEFAVKMKEARENIDFFIKNTKLSQEYEEFLKYKEKINNR